MLPRLAVPGLLLGVLLSAAAAPAATFRLQGATPGADGTFSVGAVANGRIRGEFSVLTDYRDKDGNVVNTPGNQLQAWSIVISNGGTVLDRFVTAYSSPGQGGLADKSSKSAAVTRQLKIPPTAAPALPRWNPSSTAARWPPGWAPPWPPRPISSCSRPACWPSARWRCSSAVCAARPRRPLK